MLYSIRGYVEDSNWVNNRTVEPGTKIDCDLPIWRIAEGLLFASRLGTAFDSIEEIGVHCCFTGLNGRSLISLNPLLIGFWGTEYLCRDNDVTFSAVVSQEQIQNNLVEVLHGLLQPLFERFSLYSLSASHVQRVLKEMKVA